MTSVLSLSQARRLALGAQGLTKPRPTGPATARQVGLAFDRLQLLQIDSVNVLARSHYLPLFARLGPYEQAHLDRLAGEHPRRMVEYWAHEASFVRPALFPYLLPLQKRRWVGAGSVPEELRESLRFRIREVLAVSQPLTAPLLQRRLGHEEIRGTDQWGWNWNSVKRVLEDMFERGEVSSAGRTPSFERRYALTEKVMPDPLAAAAEVDPVEAQVVLIELAARALGVGTLRCFADYFRLPLAASSTAIETLVARGTLNEVRLMGWDKQAVRHERAVLPRKAEGRALLSPFDSMVFERRRLSALFGFDYRIEIYTPAGKRRYGYYVLPFLLREKMAARVDLKADRGTRRLLVRGSHSEPDAPPDTARELAAELRLMATWLGLDEVVVDHKGNLAEVLKLAVSRE